MHRDCVIATYIKMHWAKNILLLWLPGCIIFYEIVGWSWLALPIFFNQKCIIIFSTVKNDSIKPHFMNLAFGNLKKDRKHFYLLSFVIHSHPNEFLDTLFYIWGNETCPTINYYAQRFEHNFRKTTHTISTVITLVYLIRQRVCDGWGTK